VIDQTTDLAQVAADSLRSAIGIDRYDAAAAGWLGDVLAFVIGLQRLSPVPLLTEDVRAELEDVYRLLVTFDSPDAIHHAAELG